VPAQRLSIIFRKFTFPKKVFIMVINVNGVTHEVAVEPGDALLTVLRDQLELTGPKYGCGEGACGACTVLINGAATRSCITAVSSVAGKEVMTIEGIEKNGKLHPIQEAFLKTDVFQCSYCASGMIMSSVALLKNNATPSEEAIIKAMNGNICRCGTYPYIMKAIKLACQS
jgi:aerobic-type carbon monoxide dehydrogenase small subunit (CoxS/CutS family)